MLGLMTANSGKVTLLGQDVQIDKTRQKIGFVLEADGLYDNLTAYDNLLFYAKLLRYSKPAQKVDKILKQVGLADRAKDKGLNLFQRHAPAVGAGPRHRPRPGSADTGRTTAGVDPTGQIEIRQLMLDMINKEGKTILLSSHNLDEVQRICNRIAPDPSGTNPAIRRAGAV